MDQFFWVLAPTARVLQTESDGVLVFSKGRRKKIKSSSASIVSQVIDYLDRPKSHADILRRFDTCTNSRAIEDLVFLLEKHQIVVRSASQAEDLIPQKSPSMADFLRLSESKVLSFSQMQWQVVNTIDRGRHRFGDLETFSHGGLKSGNLIVLSSIQEIENICSQIRPLDLTHIVVIVPDMQGFVAGYARLEFDGLAMDVFLKNFNRVLEFQTEFSSSSWKDCHWNLMELLVQYRIRQFFLSHDEPRDPARIHAHDFYNHRDVLFDMDSMGHLRASGEIQ